MYDYYPNRLVTVVTSPASEPVTLTEAKLYLRIDTTTEDTLITDMIASARSMAEAYLRRSLITQTIRIAFDDMAPDATFLPRPPVQSITSVKAIARDGSEVTIDSNSYTLNAAKDAVCFDATVIGDRVEITYVAGYGNSAGNVPVAIRQGMLAHIAVLYDARGQCAIPPASLAAYAPYREVRL